MCRDIFDTNAKNGLSPAMEVEVDYYDPLANVVAVSIAVFASILIAFFMRGGTERKENERSETSEDGASQHLPVTSAPSYQKV
jgi:hypothetical protein